MVKEFDDIGNEIIPDEIIDLRMKLSTLFNKMIILLEKKRMDYGLSYDRSRDEFGPNVLSIRLGDKLNRYKKLVKDLGEAQNEPLIDTLYDIIGYTTLEILYRNKTKGIIKEVNK